MSEDASRQVPASPDEIEQRQRTDGTFEGVTDGLDVPDGPVDPDVLEQRQRPDGSFEGDVIGADVPDRPLTPDELEQRQVVELDEDDRRDG